MLLYANIMEWEIDSVRNQYYVLNIPNNGDFYYPISINIVQNIVLILSLGSNSIINKEIVWPIQKSRRVTRKLNYCLDCKDTREPFASGPRFIYNWRTVHLERLWVQPTNSMNMPSSITPCISNNSMVGSLNVIICVNIEVSNDISPWQCRCLESLTASSRASFSAQTPPEFVLLTECLGKSPVMAENICACTRQDPVLSQTVQFLQQG